MISTKIDDTAQEGLISTLLYLPGGVKDVMGLLKEDDFSNGRMKTIYHAIIKLTENNDDITYSSIVSWLTGNGKLQQAGGADEVRRLFGAGAMNGTLKSTTDWARIIKEASLQRSLNSIVDEAKDNLAKSTKRARDIISGMQSESNELMTQLSDNSGVMDIKDTYDDYVTEIETRKKVYDETGGNPLAARHGIPSGFPTIDKYVGGWTPGMYITVAGRTSVGKSFTASNFMIAAAEAKKSVMLFSAEMPSNQVLDRFIAAIANVKFSGIKQGRLNDEDLKKIHDASEAFHKMKIKIVDTPGMDMNYIRAEAMKAAQSDDGLDLIIIDYLQLIKPDDYKDNREQQVAKISWSIKTLAAQLNIPIISLCQLNRVKKDDEDPTPRIDDIRESGRIAQDSSTIILIDRNIADFEAPTTFIIGKNREGRAGVRFKCHSLLDYGKFVEINEDGDMFNDKDSSTQESNSDTESSEDTPVNAQSDDSSSDTEYISDNPDKIDEWISNNNTADPPGDSSFDNFDDYEGF